MKKKKIKSLKLVTEYIIRRINMSIESSLTELSKQVESLTTTIKNDNFLPWYIDSLLVPLILIAVTSFVTYKVSKSQNKKLLLKESYSKVLTELNILIHHYKEIGSDILTIKANILQLLDPEEPNIFDLDTNDLLFFMINSRKYIKTIDLYKKRGPFITEKNKGFYDELKSSMGRIDSASFLMPHFLVFQRDIMSHLFFTDSKTINSIEKYKDRIYHFSNIAYKGFDIENELEHLSKIQDMIIAKIKKI